MNNAPLPTFTIAMAAVLELEARLDNLLSTAQTETADIDLFAPITDREECPLCLIPHSLDDDEIILMACCGKQICFGCVYKHMIADVEKGLQHYGDQKCAFCRQQQIDQDGEIKNLKKLMKKNNPQAFIQMAIYYQSGDGVSQSDNKALEMYIHAAELGSIEAYENIGHTIAERDMSKALEYYEVAAKKGSWIAHRALAKFHGTNGNTELFFKHMKIAASAGDQELMDGLKSLIPKEDFAQTLRLCQASQNRMKSKDRDDARAFYAELEQDE